MTFADAILKLRSERRMSQTQLAKELGVSYTSVNRWENGRSLPTKMMLLVICRYCEEHHLEFSCEEVGRPVVKEMMLKYRHNADAECQVR